MVGIVLVNKFGVVNYKNVSKLEENNLYKKAGFRKDDDFERKFVWDYNTKYIMMYAKSVGKANNENKFELPPPIDKDLYYGTIAFVKSNSKTDFEVNDDFTIDDLNKFIEEKFGGFEDIVETDDESSSNESIQKELLTKEGYLKDDFVVDDTSSSNDISEEELYYEGELQYETYTDEES